MNSVEKEELTRLLKEWNCSELSETLLEFGFTIRNLHTISTCTILYLFSENEFVASLLNFKELLNWMKAKAEKKITNKKRLSENQNVVTESPESLETSPHISTHNDEPVSKMAKMTQPEEDIKNYIVQVLSDGNVDVIAVRNKVEAKYPSAAEYDKAFFTDEISLFMKKLPQLDNQDKGRNIEKESNIVIKHNNIEEVTLNQEQQQLHKQVLLELTNKIKKLIKQFRSNLSEDIVLGIDELPKWIHVTPCASRVFTATVFCPICNKKSTPQYRCGKSGNYGFDINTFRRHLVLHQVNPQSKKHHLEKLTYSKTGKQSNTDSASYKTSTLNEDLQSEELKSTATSGPPTAKTDLSTISSEGKLPKFRYSESCTETDSDDSDSE